MADFALGLVSAGELMYVSLALARGVPHALLTLLAVLALVINLANTRQGYPFAPQEDSMSAVPSDDEESVRRDARPHMMRRVDSGWEPLYLCDEPIYPEPDWRPEPPLLPLVAVISGGRIRDGTYPKPCRTSCSARAPSLT